jgi:hypothetical protein
MHGLIPIQWPNPTMLGWKEWAARLIQELDRFKFIVNNHLLPIAGSISLAVTPATTTVISDERIGVDSRIALTAATANGAAALATTYATVAAGSITLNHTASTLTDRTFHYVIFP